MALSLEIIRANFRSRKRRRLRWKENADDDFTIYLYAAYRLTKSIFDQKKRGKRSNKLTQTGRIAANNFVVNCVTALESYFRNIILENCEWSDEGLSSLLKEKVTLKDAYEMFGKEKVSREFIVAHYFSFQSLESIDSIFSKLTNAPFFNTIETHLAEFDGSETGAYTFVLRDEYPDWRNHLALMYEIRNRYIHECHLADLTTNDVDNLFEIVGILQEVVHEFMGATYNISLQKLLKKR